MGNDQAKFLDTTTPDGVRAMDENLQRKFSKGIQYNMKIIVRGDRNTGKTCLLKRMQGLPFTEAYIPTDEIQVAHIQWTYPCTNDTVKVEIWDIVDQGRSSKSKKNAPLKLTNKATPQDVALDASFLDVYKGAHGIIFMYDITKQWTWQYIERELQNVPMHVPIVVVGNYSDMRDHRTITMEDAEFYVTHLNRPEGAADIRYAESCLKNGFGLRYLHKFLSIPFLQLQQESLLHQLKNNREQIMLVNEGLDSKDEQNYDKFLDDKSKPVVKKQPSTETPPSATPPQQSPPLPRNEPIQQNVPPPSPPPSVGGQTTSNEGGSFARKFSSKFTGFLSKSKTQEPSSVPSPKSPGRPRQPAVENVDDFVPDGDLDDHFFEGGVREGEGGGESDDESSEDDNERTNPLVAMDEDLSSQEEEEEEPPVVPIKGRPSPIINKIKLQQELSESEEEEEEGRPVVTMDEDLSSEEEEEEEKEIEKPKMNILQPTLVPKPKTTPKTTPIVKQPLKPMHDIVLTDSEEEAGPVVMGDEDIPEPVEEPVRKSKKSGSGLLLTHHSPVTKKPPKIKDSPSTKSKNSPGGLLLDFTDGPGEESPSLTKKEKKKSRRSSTDKKSHKKRKSSKQFSIEEEEEKAVPIGSGTTPTLVSDPFDFGPSLDAWLGSDDSPSIQPRSTHGLTKAIQQSLEDNDESPSPKVEKKKKKHRESGGGGGGSGTKKKSKSKKKEETPSFDNLL